MGEIASTMRVLIPVMFINSYFFTVLRDTPHVNILQQGADTWISIHAQQRFSNSHRMQIMQYTII